MSFSAPSSASGIADAAAEIEHVPRLGELVREPLVLGLVVQQRRDVARHLGQRVRQLLLLGFADGAARAAERDRQAGQHAQLAGERLGGGDADLGARQRRQDDVRLARDGGRAHVDDGGDALALRLAIAQRRQRIGRLARLRDEQGEAALLQRRLAIAELGGHVDLDGDARIPLEPVLADDAGVVGGAAGRDGDLADLEPDRCRGRAGARGRRRNR